MFMMTTGFIEAHSQSSRTLPFATDYRAVNLSIEVTPYVVPNKLRHLPTKIGTQIPNLYTKFQLKPLIVTIIKETKYDFEWFT